MKQYNAKNIRNIVLAGHGGKGKTTLAEAMIFLSGASDRLGKVAEGNTVLDYDAEEKKRKSSVSTAVAPIEWKNVKINLIDTPGFFDFAGGLSEGIRAADCALIVLSAKSGVSVGTEKAFKAATKHGIGKMFVVSKIDSENSDFYKVFSNITSTYGASACPVVIPIMEDGKVKSYVNLIEQKAYIYKNGKREETEMPPKSDRFDAINLILNEAIASSDDDLLEKYFDGKPFTIEEKVQGLTKGIASGSIYPVFACSGLTTEAVDLLLDCIVQIAPSAEMSASEEADKDGTKVKVACDENGPLAAIAFKTIADPFVGKLSFFKVISGKLSSDVQAYNTRTGENERIGKVVTMRGAKQEDAGCIPAGDIGAITKLSGTNTGDTLCAPSNKVVLEGIDFSAPCLSMAVKVKKKGEEEKVAAGLGRLIEEDPTLSFKINTETHEQILSGLGEQHLDVAASKLKSKFGVEITLEVPKVAYRETIRKKVKVQGRHKKQSGGHGQYGDVWIEFEPCDSDNLVFEEKVFGGAVPKNFFPAVEKGLRESVTKGVLAGYPMVGVKATLVDGSYHPVDSSEMSFKMAAALAYKNGIPQASPVILEPIGIVKAYITDDVMGDIIGDINKRRGRVLGMNPTEEDNIQELVAEVPMAEMGDFSTVLRSITQGRGYFSLNFERYEEAPDNIGQKIIAEAKAKESE